MEEIFHKNKEIEADDKQILKTHLLKRKQEAKIMNDKNIKKAIVSGSFDPFTNGHLEIVKQASEIFDKVYVVIFTNSKKTRKFNEQKMVDAIKETLKDNDINNCIVDISHNLLAEYCIENDITYTVRGLRNNMDYNYEENISEVNKLLNPGLKSIYLKSENKALSSSMIRELLQYNKDVSKYVPDKILEIIKR